MSKRATWWANPRTKRCQTCAQLDDAVEALRRIQAYCGDSWRFEQIKEFADHALRRLDGHPQENDTESEATPQSARGGWLRECCGSDRRDGHFPSCGEAT